MIGEKLLYVAGGGFERCCVNSVVLASHAK